MGRDRISELPDSLLAHILSYLPLYESMRTSVLSKRWEFLWLMVSGLDLDAFYYPYGELVVSFMNRYMEFNRGSRLQSFKVKYDDYVNLNKRFLEWIATAVDREIQHLDVETELVQRTMGFMPMNIYKSKRLVSLKLKNVGLENPEFVVSLPCLKIMHLAEICYRGNDGHLIIEKLISGSPVLEDLTLDFPVSKELSQIDFPNVPQCLTSTLEHVEIKQLIMEEETGIKLVNYFLENSAALKKIDLSFTTSPMPDKGSEMYKKLLTSRKLSRRCQVLVW